jgi:hypothetical protein
MVAPPHEPPPVMHEHDVRKLLFQSEIRRIAREKPETRVINEMVLLRGAARIDVAVINDALHGYEIKSALDNLQRLPEQQSCYAKVFERVTLVADESHVEHAVRLVPKCWGLIAVGMKDGKPHANEIWPATRNHQLDRMALAQLLWRDEAIELMEYFGLATGMRSKPKKDLWKTLAKNLSVEELKAFVCYKLRNRKDWGMVSHSIK